MIRIKVSGQNGFVLIVGDTGYNSNSWNEQRLPGPVYDKDKFIKSLQWIQSESKKPQCMAILASHDSGYTNDTIEIQEEKTI